MGPQDKEEFDGLHVDLIKLTETSEGREFLQRFIMEARTGGQFLWYAAKPILATGGDVLLGALKSYASTLLSQELDRLAGNR